MLTLTFQKWDVWHQISPGFCLFSSVACLGSAINYIALTVSGTSHCWGQHSRHDTVFAKTNFNLVLLCLRTLVARLGSTTNNVVLTASSFRTKLDLFSLTLALLSSPFRHHSLLSSVSSCCVSMLYSIIQVFVSRCWASTFRPQKYK